VAQHARLMGRGHQRRVIAARGAQFEPRVPFRSGNHCDRRIQRSWPSGQADAPGVSARLAGFSRR